MTDLKETQNVKHTHTHTQMALRDTECYTHTHTHTHTHTNPTQPLISEHQHESPRDSFTLLQAWRLFAFVMVPSLRGLHS